MIFVYEGNIHLMYSRNRNESQSDWFIYKHSYYLNKTTESNIIELSDVIIHELLQKLRCRESCISMAMHETRGETINCIRKASDLLLKLGKGQNIDPVTIMVTYAQSGLFYANQGNTRQVIPIIRIMDFLKLTNSEVYLILLACTDHSDQRVRTTIFLDCINVLHQREDAELKQFLSELQYRYCIHYPGWFEHPFGNISAINLPAARTFLYTKKHALTGEDRELFEEFCQEVNNTESVDGFMALVLRKLKANDENDVISNIVLEYVYNDPSIYNEIIKTPNSQDGYTMAQYYHGAQIMFFHEEPKATKPLLEELHTKIKKRYLISPN